jgi:hypothetical protein
MTFPFTKYFRSGIIRKPDYEVCSTISKPLKIIFSPLPYRYPREHLWIWQIVAQRFAVRITHSSICTPTEGTVRREIFEGEIFSVV